MIQGENINMRTKLLGKNIKRKWFVETHVVNKEAGECDDKVTYTFDGVPELKNDETCTNEVFMEYKGEPCFNHKKWSSLVDIMNISMSDLIGQMNISENETVNVFDKIFRADEGDYWLYTDKILSEEDQNKSELEKNYQHWISIFNRTMIEQDKKLKDRCDLYNLNYEKTDSVKLFKEVYGCENVEIKDGKLVKDNKATHMVSMFVNGETIRIPASLK